MKWSTEKRKIEDVKEFSKNPRQIRTEEAAQLSESLDKFGQCEPIIVNVDGTLIGGHQRLRILKNMGYKEVDVSIPDVQLSEKQVEELNIRLNKNTGEFDFDILGNLWDPEELIGYGFSANELGIDIETVLKDDDEKEEKTEKATSMSIKFKNPDHLQDAENRIRTIVDEYEGATCNVRL